MFSPDFRTYFLEFIIIGTFADNRNKYMVISRLGKPPKKMTKMCHLELKIEVLGLRSMD